VIQRIQTVFLLLISIASGLGFFFLPPLDLSYLELAVLHSIRILPYIERSYCIFDPAVVQKKENPIDDKSDTLCHTNRFGDCPNLWIVQYG
jgi:hypothetical protein